VKPLRQAIFATFVVLLLIPLAYAEDSDGDGFSFEDDCNDEDPDSTIKADDADCDGYEDPNENFGVWDGADAYPNNPDVHDPVFSTGCDPPVATLDLQEPVTFTCTIRNEGPVGLNVLIDVKDDIHLTDQFDAAYYDIGPSEVLELQVTLSGLSEGVATAKLRIFARANNSSSHSIDLPIEVTGDEWAGINSQSQGGNAPDISFINGFLDEFADWLSEHTPWEINRMMSASILLVTSLVLIGSIRLVRARNIWKQNMAKKTSQEQKSEARFDAIRRGGEHQHHVEPTIPDSPEYVIRRKP